MSGRLAFLLALGVLGFLGDLLSLPTLRRLASATAASPTRGRRATFIALVEADEGRTGRPFTLSGEAFSRLDGPPVRRRFYETVLVDGPSLEVEPTYEAVVQAVLPRVLCGQRMVLAEMGMPPAGSSSLRVRYPSRRDADPSVVPSSGQTPILEARCR